LVADGWHLFTDVVTSIGVLVGVALVALSGWTVFDPILAGLVALNILWMGWRLMKESLGGLMDAAPPLDVQNRIRDIISKEGSGALEAHDLRTRHAGRLTFIDFHLVVAGQTTVAEAHDICDRIERALEDDMGEAIITIHVEPEGKAKHSGIVVL
jgi:cation diffusion facilitator family transporter